MTIYIDSDFRCHLTNDGTMCSVETDFFEGKCKTFIEGYRLVPAGERWTRVDGMVFYGMMVTSAENYARLEKAQQQYEADEINHLNELGALIEDLYNTDLEVIG